MFQFLLSVLQCYERFGLRLVDNFSESSKTRKSQKTLKMKFSQEFHVNRNGSKVLEQILQDLHSVLFTIEFIHHNTVFDKSL